MSEVRSYDESSSTWGVSNSFEVYTGFGIYSDFLRILGILGIFGIFCYLSFKVYGIIYPSYKNFTSVSTIFHSVDGT